MINSHCIEHVVSIARRDKDNLLSADTHSAARLCQYVCVGSQPTKEQTSLDAAGWVQRLPTEMR